MPPQITVKRIYDPPTRDDGYRVLVDRLWPRGVRKEEARLDQWARELTPSPELRTWFDHEPSRFARFTKKYQDELRECDEQVEAMLRAAGDRAVTLLYAAADPVHNHAVILRDHVAAFARKNSPAT